MTYATFTKLRNGEWGLRYEGTLSPGDVVQTKTKAGEIGTAEVEWVVYEKEGLCLATFSKTKKADLWDDYTDEVTF